MAEEIFEQVVDEQSISGGFNTIIEKLLEIQNEVRKINEKIPEARTG